MLSWLIFTLCFAFQAWAVVDVTIPYTDLTYLPSRDHWVLTNSSCPHLYTNVAGAAVKYTFTGTAVKFFIPKAGNGANVKITFSDGTTWNYNSQGAFGCGNWYGLTFPPNQYKPLSVTLEPTGGGFINMEKIVVTQLTDSELQSLSSRPTAVVTTSNTVVPPTSSPRTSQAPQTTQTTVIRSTIISSTAVGSVTSSIATGNSGLDVPTGSDSVTSAPTETLTSTPSSESTTLSVGSNTDGSREKAESESSGSSSNKSTVAAPILGTLLGVLILGLIGAYVWWKRKKLFKNLYKSDGSQPLSGATNSPYSNTPMASMNPIIQYQQPVTQWTTGYGQHPGYYPTMAQQMPYTPGQTAVQWTPQPTPSPPQAVANPFEQDSPQAQGSQSGLSDHSRFTETSKSGPSPPYTSPVTTTQHRPLPSAPA
ncbi:hypothetical protein FRC02_009140 [Tulasnella sp. 418]|nr:hypothetical protein FRC02_009140 [Tulasnella sp. 418]